MDNSESWAFRRDASCRQQDACLSDVPEEGVNYTNKTKSLETFWGIATDSNVAGGLDPEDDYV